MAVVGTLIVFLLAGAAARAAAADGNDLPAGEVQADCIEDPATQTPTPTPVPLVIVSGFVFDEHLTVIDQGVPVAGAWLSFVVNNTTYSTVTNLLGAYSIVIPAEEECTVVVSAAGFATRILPLEFKTTQTRDFFLFPIPANWIQAYALYPVLETSPGRDLDCTIAVDNCQIIDQTVTMSVVAPDGWIVWFPQGEALNLESGTSNALTFRLRYCGNVYGPQTITVTVSAATYSEQVPVVVVVKDLPFEEIDLFANSYFKEVQPGAVALFQLQAFNFYRQGKSLTFVAVTPPGWNYRTEDFAPSKSQRTDDEYFIYREDKGEYTFLLRVYVPTGTADGIYPITITLAGDGVISNTFPLFVKVNSSRFIRATIIDNAANYRYSNEIKVDYNGSSDTITYGMGKNCTAYVHINVTNHWPFPIFVDTNAFVLDERNFTGWATIFFVNSTINMRRINIFPEENVTITAIVTPPNGLTGEHEMYFGFSATDQSTGFPLDETKVSATFNISAGNVSKTTSIPGGNAINALLSDAVVPVSCLIAVALSALLRSRLKRL